MPRLSVAIRDIILSDDNMKLVSAGLYSWEVQGRREWWRAERIRMAWYKLQDLADEIIKPSKAEVSRFVEDLKQNWSLGAICAAEDYKRGHALCNALFRAIEQNENSLIIYQRYPVLEHDSTLRLTGATLGLSTNQAQWGDLASLTDTTLKTAILERMLDILKAPLEEGEDNATAFYRRKYYIQNCDAYKILGISRSFLKTKVFFTGKTTSQDVIDTLIAERARELNIPLTPPRLRAILPEVFNRLDAARHGVHVSIFFPPVEHKTDLTPADALINRSLGS